MTIKVTQTYVLIQLLSHKQHTISINIYKKNQITHPRHVSTCSDIVFKYTLRYKYIQDPVTPLHPVSYSLSYQTPIPGC